MSTTDTTTEITSQQSVIEWPKRRRHEGRPTVARLNHLAGLDIETRLRELEAHRARADYVASTTLDALQMVTQRLLDLPLPRGAGSHPLAHVLDDLRAVGVHLAYLEVELRRFVDSNDPDTVSDGTRGDLMRPTSPRKFVDLDA